MAMLDLKKLISRMLGVQTYDYTKFTYSSGFAAYATSGVEAPCAYKNGRVVTLTGAIKTTAAQSSTGQKIIGTIPPECKPINTFRVISQGTGQNRYLLQISSQGNLIAERYGGATDTAMPNGIWLNISCTYISSI